MRDSRGRWGGLKSECVGMGNRGKLGRGRGYLGLLAVLFTSGLLLLAPGEAQARSHRKHHHVAAPTVTDLESSAKYAAFVGEPETGRILFERRSDSQRFPASLTKMMTLYELFKALDQGQTRLSDPLRVSAHGSIQAPSKLGLDAGDTIAVEDAIKAIVVVSANDVAVTIAENLGGSEQAFAKRMTADAKLLGMTNTQFVNASGLPDDDQLSTARDMYTLASHLIADFPQYYHYFALESFRWNGRRFASHNHLVGRVDGVDGMKTGYIRASGFHLVSSAKRNGHRLIAVVMGGETSRQRDDAVKRLLNTEFAALDKAGPMVASAAPVPASPAPAAAPAPSGGPYPRPKPGEELAQVTGGGVVQPVSAPGALPAAIAALPGANPAAGSPAALPSAPVQTAALLPPAPPPATNEGPTVASLLAPSAQASPRPVAPQDTQWGIQIGAYVSAETASSKLAAARKALPKLLGRTTQTVARVAVDDTAYYRARFGPLDEAEAKRACDLLGPHGFKCFTIQAPEAELASGAPQ